ncbi:serine/threonine protein kinase [Candidatus Uabimicrobium sp. HlEnr_7]|uniref:serine/threonine protein kinase n=1 Tax=Candidatus Uabimicrobium helgolandensis TaxID=3095367 RepID=UPI003556C4B7
MDNFDEHWKKILNNWDGTTDATFNSNKWEDDLNHDAEKKLETISIDYQVAQESPSSPDKKGLDFEIEEEIARGGMGIIYKGYQTSLGRKVAIKKIIANTQQTGSRYQFVSESKITAYLDHPNIIPVYDLGANEDSELVLVMKLVEGKSWREIMSHKTYSLEKNLEVMLDLMNAIAFAHDKGIVHNDLKPDNVMIGEYGEVVLMDWGIAVDFRDEPNSNFPSKQLVKNPLGTPSYMAPELANGDGEQLGPWTDIYLLGAILYEILMGKPPHLAEEFTMTLSSVMQHKELKWNDNVSRELKQICLKAMSFKPKDRYKSISELKKDIEGYIQHKESIIVSQNAQKMFEAARKKIKKADLSDREHGVIYNYFSGAIAGFCQAVELWKENKEAEEGAYNARLEYAQTAIKNLDLGLAQSQIDILSPEDKLVINLQQQIKNAAETRECNAISERLIKISKLIVFAFIFRQIAVLTLPPPPVEVYLSQNNMRSFLCSILIIGFFLVALYLLRKGYTRMKPLLTLSVLLEISSVTAMAFFIASLDHGPEASITGVYASSFLIALFRITIPYKRKIALIVGLTSATAAVVVFFLTKLLLGIPFPPHMIAMPFVVESYLLAVIGILLAKRN